MKTDTVDRALTGAPVSGNSSSAIARREARADLPALADDLGADVSAGQLILAAIDKGASVETLEKLVALKERIEDRDAARAFIRAMAAFQAECPLIRKKTTAKITTAGGGSYSYTYAELDEIVATIAPLVEAHGFSYTWDAKVEANGFLTCTIRIRHIGGHSETSSFSLPTDTKSAMSSQQKQAAANTFAKRQTLVSGFGLTTTDEDTDGAEPRQMDPTTITEDQVVALEDLLAARNAGKPKEKAEAFRARFLSHMDVDAIAKIPVGAFDRAVAALQPPAPKGGAQ